MGSFGPLELGLIFLVILLVFGAKRIPEIARGLGQGIQEFKQATNEFTRELNTREPVRQTSRPSRQEEPSRPTGSGDDAE